MLVSSSISGDKGKPVITDVHPLTRSINSLNRWGHIKATTIPSVGLPHLLTTFLLPFAPDLKLSVFADPEAAPGPSNTVAELSIVDILSSSERTEHRVFFAACRLSKIRLTSVSRRRR